MILIMDQLFDSRYEIFDDDIKFVYRLVPPTCKYCNIK